MALVGRIRKGEYFDSVTLMNVAREIAALPGVVDAGVVMGTDANKRILAASGLLTPELEEAGDSDVLIALRVEEGGRTEAVTEAADDLLDRARETSEKIEEFHPRSIEGALQALPAANLALISVPGRYAGEEARKAIESGLHVMIFSDNVSSEEEIELKTLARERGLLVMGPDCGTAIVNGVPLGFANEVRRGPVGIVAASGTGLQEVSSILSNEGVGISQAIGTGGRDVTSEVGGIMFLEGIRALAADEETRILVLISKPPGEDLLDRIAGAVRGIGKPVVSVLLGAHAEALSSWATLEEAALQAACLAREEDPSAVRRLLDSREEEIREAAEREAAGRARARRFVRGLYSGGTFCAEAQVLLRDSLPGVHSNAPIEGVSRLKDALVSRENTLVDMGADEFTVGRPHPMIDYSLRVKRMIEEAEDPSVAVILLDVVLGHGAHPDPLAELGPAVRNASSRVSVVCSVTGTDSDPQDRPSVMRGLREAGASVMQTNAAAARFAGHLVRSIGGE